MSDRDVNLLDEPIDLAVRLSNRIDAGLIARRLAVRHLRLVGFLGTGRRLRAVA